MPEALPKKGDPKTIYVIDISSYVFRAYHALPPLSNSKGEPTHAVAGVASMLLKLLREREPQGVIVAMDSKGKSFRKELYADYKANRPPAPPDLEQQMVRVREIAEAWGMSPIEAPGFEADDVIATLVTQARGKGLRVVIVSADKDLLQLVGPDVVMYDTMRDKVFGAEETREKLGVEPAAGARSARADGGQLGQRAGGSLGRTEDRREAPRRIREPRRHLREPRRHHAQSAQGEARRAPGQGAHLPRARDPAPRRTDREGRRDPRLSRGATPPRCERFSASSS